MVLPASINESRPFVGQRTNCFVVLVAAAPLLIIVGSRPARPFDRTIGEFVKTLADELRARQTAPDKFGLAAAFGDRCDAGEALNFLGALITRAIGAKGGYQSWGQDLTGSRQGIEDLLVGVLLVASLDLLIKGFNPCNQTTQWFEQCLNHGD